jgi:hypothetical protein
MTRSVDITGWRRSVKGPNYKLELLCTCCNLIEEHIPELCPQALLLPLPTRGEDVMRRVMSRDVTHLSALSRGTFYYSCDAEHLLHNV